jgi:FkbH-like protein
VKFTEALQCLQNRPQGGTPFDVTLACGFTPLHVQTFLAAHLQQRLPEQYVTVRPGLLGDLIGTLENSTGQAVAVPLEWAGLDPRLGFRSADTWSGGAVAEMVVTARETLRRLAAIVARIPQTVPIALSLPTLPLPPLFHAVGAQLGSEEAALNFALEEFVRDVSAYNNCRIVNRTYLAERSPASERYDCKADLLTGRPYTLRHADVVGAALAELLAPAPPKKGIITDLDGTLWAGIVGEDGPANVSWDLASHHQIHALYQKLLAALAFEGVLVGIASKNDPAVAGEALARKDMLISPGGIFPAEIHWHAKSISVARILKAWNAGAGSVVFVDDSPMELAEVAAAHPGIECLLFPKNGPAAGYALLRRLRDLFGKPHLSGEDSLRLDSVRRGAAFREAAAEGSVSDTFLEQAAASLTFDFESGEGGARTLELVNKTNQFNLNGVRLNPAGWQARLARPAAWMATIGYRDRFGPLGRIAVVQGRHEAGCLHVETWVMSCRALSRRIEHRTLKTLFERFEVEEVHFDFAPTPKNGPFQDFVAPLLGARPEAPFTLTRTRFFENCPPLYQQVSEAQHA